MRTTAIAVVTLLGATACSGAAPPGDTVKVGLLVPLSGTYAAIGTDMKDGFQLYLDQHHGKMGGRTVDLVTADEGQGTETGVPAAARLLQRDQVDVATGVVNSAVALGIKELFNTYRKPLIVSNAGADAITRGDGSKYLWRTSFANGEVSGSIGAHVAKEVEGPVQLVGADYAAGKEHLAGFRKTFTAAGGKVAGTQMTPFGRTKDFQPYLSNIRKSGAKAVFAFYAGAEAVSFVKQYEQFGLSGKVPLYASGFLTEGGALKAQGDSAAGIKTTLNYAPGLDNPANKRFAAAYRAKTGRTPTTYAVSSYDAAVVLDQALRLTDVNDGIADALPSVGTIESPRGTWRFGKNRGPEQTYYLREARKNGACVENVVIQKLTR